MIKDRIRRQKAWEITGFFGNCNCESETIAVFDDLQKAKKFIIENFKNIENASDKINFYSRTFDYITTDQVKVKKYSNLYKKLPTFEKDKDYNELVLELNDFVNIGGEVLYKLDDDNEYQRNSIRL